MDLTVRHRIVQGKMILLDIELSDYLDLIGRLEDDDMGALLEVGVVESCLRWWLWEVGSSLLEWDIYNSSFASAWVTRGKMCINVRDFLFALPMGERKMWVDLMSKVMTVWSAQPFEIGSWSEGVEDIRVTAG